MSTTFNKAPACVLRGQDGLDKHDAPRDFLENRIESRLNPEDDSVAVGSLGTKIRSFAKLHNEASVTTIVFLSALLCVVTVLSHSETLIIDRSLFADEKPVLHGADTGSSADAPFLRAYTFRAEAEIDDSSNHVVFHGDGKVTVEAPRPMRGIQMNCEFENRNGTIWIDPGFQGPERIVVPRDSRELLVNMFEPTTSLSLVFLAQGSVVRLGNPVLLMADGTEFAMAGLFRSGDERLGPHQPYPGHLPEPETETLSEAAARDLIEKEWWLQRGRRNRKAVVADELERSERILKRQSAQLKASVLNVRSARLAELKAGSASVSETASEALYLEIRRFKREMMLNDPEIDFDSIVCIDIGYSSNPHQITHRNAAFAAAGGRLLLLEGLGPDAEVRKLAPRHDGSASFWRPDVSYDGQKVLFSMKPRPQGAFHIYEVNVDGTGLRQITQGDYDDLDPVYAPDGGIVFTTTRCNQILPCGDSQFRLFILARMDSDGQNIYFLSANIISDYLPEFLPDGRILFTRWEYYDKSVSRIMSLWTVNPDGTGLNAFWGNQSYWPDMLWSAAQIPGTRKILFNSAGHHTVFTGSLGIIDQKEGMNYPDGLYKLTPAVPWVEVGDGPEKQRNYNEEFQPPSCYVGYQTPFPVSRNYVLVSARTGYEKMWIQNEVDRRPHNLYLMDYDGNMELLYPGVYNIFHARPVRERSQPRRLPSAVRWPGRMTSAGQQAERGILYSSDVYEGTSIPRGKVKALRVLEAEARHFGNAKGGSDTPEHAKMYQKQGAFPGCDLVGETPVSFVYADSPKRILGTVQVEKDGSVSFEVPPVRALYFQLLDKDGRCLQTMRSMTHVMPGEVRGCVGCHETRAVAPPAGGSLATQREPSKLEPPAWGNATVSFPRFVQPVLDRHCVSCHNPEKSNGGFDFTHRAEDPQDFSWPYVKLLFGLPNYVYSSSRDPKYWTEVKENSIAGPIFPAAIYNNPEVEYPTQETVVPPMTAMSYQSRLIDIATSGTHHDVQVSGEEAARLIAWVDALCPYNGLEELMVRPDPVLAPESRLSLPFPPRMRTAPMVHKAFKQDGFDTQADRLPRDKDGKELPSIVFRNGKRFYRLPERN